jgi:hypothetical protein
MPTRPSGEPRSILRAVSFRRQFRHARSSRQEQEHGARLRRFAHHVSAMVLPTCSVGEDPRYAL